MIARLLQHGDGGSPAVWFPARGTSTSGAVSEYAAVVKLLERGHKVAIPVVDDDGVDLVVNYRIRVQIKGAARPMPASRSHYSWPFNLRASAQNCDVVLLHARLHDAWWVIPLGELASLMGLQCSVNMSIDPGRKTRYSALQKRRDAWDLFRDPLFFSDRPELSVANASDSSQESAA